MQLLLLCLMLLGLCCSSVMRACRSPATPLSLRTPHPTTHTPTPTPTPHRQLSDADLVSFLLKVPSVLRLSNGKLAAQMDWWRATGQMTRRQVVRAYRSWPQIATTSREVLKDR